MTNTCASFTERLIVITGLTILLVFTGIVVLPAQGQTRAPEQAPAVTHNTWTSGSPMPVALKWPMTGVIKGKIYVVGGVSDTAILSNNQIYNPVANTWTTAADIPVTTFDAASAVVKNVLYLFGGSNDGETATNAAWAYNPKTNTWSAIAAMPTARDSAEAVVEKNIIYVIGGGNQNGILSTVESYNPATNSWTEEAPLLVAKAGSAIGLLGTTIVDADGYTGSVTGDTESYNASTNSWTSLTADPTPRDVPCYGPAKGSLYVAGGSPTSTAAFNLTESFKPSKKKWTTLTSMPQAVVDPGSAVYKNVLYCFGGGSTVSQFQGNVFNYVQIYQP